MHYVDEGTGDVLLFVHGTPTWSFLYRDFIRQFSQTHRCIAIDHFGFGLSEYPENFIGTPQSHAANLVEFIDQMGLSNITLVVHDFGGPIGLGAAMQRPEKIARVVLFNTWLWETKTLPEVKKIDRIINSWLGRWMYFSLNFSAKVLLRQGFAEKKKLTKTVHSQYLGPFSTRESRKAPYQLALSLAGSSDWYRQQWEQLDLLRHKPFLIIWGTKDAFLTPAFLGKWKSALTNAQVMELPVGHFSQEEAPTEGIGTMEAWLLNNKISQRSA